MSTQSTTYSLESQVRSLVNSKFSDVSFLVGEEKVLVRGHKAILALGSEVFERLFFGPMKMTSDQPIEIPDLTPVGFLNAVKYIYGYRVDEFDLADLYVTYLAGDKYLIHGMIESLFAFVKKTLSKENCCMIYDQLMKIARDEETMPLREVRDWIFWNSRDAFENEFFVRIDLYTLTDLLQLPRLNIAEIEVLKGCSRWVSERIKQDGLTDTPANKRTVFRQIKHLIRFGDLQSDELGTFTEIENLLEPDELMSLFSHLFDKTRLLAIKYDSPRRPHISTAPVFL